MDLGPPGAWVAKASCRGIELNLLDFFGKTRAEWQLARQVCEQCPVRKDCLEYALDTKATHGVWGGLDPLMLRFTLGLDAIGQPWAYEKRDVKCPLCRGSTEREELDDDRACRTCTKCGFEWERYERRERRPRKKAS